ncbi:MAG: glycosyltransferase family 2 protein [Myxococcota bacterium]|nr:glycosyltransferase family 2 protein [Myxococcota bacterium]
MNGARDEHSGDPAFHPVGVVPSYDNPATVGNVARELRKHVETVIVVDDGSADPGRLAIEALGAEGFVVVRRARNGGKGAAVKDGFARARELGASHVLQVDADGQHDLADVPALLEAARLMPEALILGRPLFDESQPRLRALSRQLSVGLVHLQTGGRVIADPMCGFRVYPLEAALRAGARGDHMEFDLELPVRMVWDGVRIVHHPTRVRYVPAEEGGVSHYAVVADTLRIAGGHVRRLLEAPFRLTRARLARRRLVRR